MLTPATYIDPAAAAAAESTILSQDQQQQLQQQQTSDDGTGYIPADDKVMSPAADHDDDVRAPVPDLGIDHLSQIDFDRLTNPEAAAVYGSSSGHAGELIGTIRNGHTSTWITEAMHASQAGLSAV